MHILVLGAAGMVGRKLVERLVRDGRLGKRDIARMTTDDGLVTADCQFCSAHYELDPKTVGFEAEEPRDG